MEYAHPLYNPDVGRRPARAAGGRTPTRIAFAGAYHGWGFHEDGARSGAAAAAHLGLPWDGADALPPSRACTRRAIRHTRRRPFRRTLRAPLAHLAGRPRRPARPRRARHASRRATTSASPDALAPGERRRVPRRARHRPRRRPGADGREPRAFGYCFNPISVFWCFDRGRRPRRHGRRGAQHLRRPARLPRPPRRAAAGRASTRRCTSRRSTAPTAGTTSRVPVPGDDLLRRGHPAHRRRRDVQRVAGRTRVPTASPRRAAPAALRGSVLIRAHGIALWLRRPAGPARGRTATTSPRKERPMTTVPEPPRDRPVARPRRASRPGRAPPSRRTSPAGCSAAGVRRLPVTVHLEGRTLGRGRSGDDGPPARRVLRPARPRRR